MKTNLVETIIGAVVIVIAAVFLVFAYRTADLGAGTGGYRVIAEFDSVNGITRGSDVRMSGIKIGTVTDQRLDPESFQAVVTMTIDPNVKLPADSSAKITSDGLLGEQYIGIDPGGSEEVLADGDVMFQTQGALDLWALVRSFMFDSGSGPATSPTPPAQADE